MGGRIGEGMPRMANERLPERSIPDRSPGHAFVRMTRVGIYSRTNYTHETGPPKSEQLRSMTSVESGQWTTVH